MDAEVRVREGYDFDYVQEVLRKFEIFSESLRAASFVIKNVSDYEFEQLKDVVGQMAEVKQIPSVSDHWEIWD